jgi:hypothetical protein
MLNTKTPNKKIPSQKLPLSKTHLLLAKQWHTSRNDALSPKDVTAGSGKKVWWQCSVDKTHIWAAIIGNRTLHKQGCPFCSGQRVCASNSLNATHPKLVKEWLQSKNGDLKPTDVTHGTRHKVWWQCRMKHQWEASISKRTGAGQGCPFCARQRILPETSLAAEFPEIARQWHQIKNGNLKPSMIAPHTTKKIWWQCNLDKEHEWLASVSSRTTMRTGCPYCANRKVGKTNSLAATHPEIAKQWHPTKNGKLKPTEVVAGSPKVVWWKCDKSKHHDWQMRVENRLKGAGCPYCSGRKVAIDTCLATKHPLVAQQWHQTLNGSLTPKDVNPGTGKKVWWRCLASPKHVWQAKVESVVRARRERLTTGCPFCAAKERDLNLRLARSGRQRSLRP